MPTEPPGRGRKPRRAIPFQTDPCTYLLQCPLVLTITALLRPQDAAGVRHPAGGGHRAQPAAEAERHHGGAHAAVRGAGDGVLPRHGHAGARLVAQGEMREIFHRLYNTHCSQVDRCVHGRAGQTPIFLRRKCTLYQKRHSKMELSTDSLTRYAFFVFAGSSGRRGQVV